MFKKIILSAVLLSLYGCGNDPKNFETKNNQNVVAFKGAKYTRVNIDGVDCVIGAGNYDTTTSVSCDWDNKDEPR